MATPILRDGSPRRKEFLPQLPFPQTLQEAFQLGYQYESSENFGDPEAFPNNPNIYEREMVFNWRVDTVGEGISEMPGLVTRLKVRFEALDIFPKKD